MEVYFFQPDVYADLYNCSQLTQEEWQQVGLRRPCLAIFLGVLGGAFAIIYMPFVAIMTKKRFFHLSCYKIMFCLGFIDAWTIIIAVGLCGYVTFEGGVFCTMPRLTYFIGVTGVASWCGSCLLCVILAVNRCLDIYYRDIHELLFDGWRTWIWISLAFLYIFLVAWFETPIFYHSRYAAGFYDPFLGAPIEKRHHFVNYTHVVNNVAVIIIMSLLYVWLCLYILRGKAKRSKTKNKFVIQTILVCAPFTIASGIYDYMQFFSPPEWVSLVGHAFYMITGGSAGLVYWLFNDNLRRELLRILARCKFLRLSKVFMSSRPNGTQLSSQTGHRPGSWA
ncbi:unnamed protein product [Bursaphelenchus xylophilus]|uniref:(pine wood nematode) hypothetical protein n=1 Tax=Bursaphelenchus xylophilus TaxID=6326 RepID=A0A7I8XCM4_BURXY|nr:unnamed protein product [Bursaphelenchus xylophilus]CAG9131743.1 unnamed protein product [Bursaphelenchus xylophilus]